MTASATLLIGVLSDTHIADLTEGMRFVERLLQGPFKDADMILHAGDIVNPEFLAVFAPVPVYAVRGNMDAASPQLPNRRVVQAGRHRIGLIHGWGAPRGQMERLLAEFEGIQLDALVFGHTHRPLCRRRDGLLLFNPGSATDRREAPSHTVGLLEAGRTLEGRILNLGQEPYGTERIS